MTIQLTHAPCKTTRMISPYGYRASTKTYHYGNDFAPLPGKGTKEPIFSVADGTVYISQFSPSGGEWIVIKHDGGWYSEYMHLSKRIVKAGAKVKSGQQIGNMGSTGHSQGEHLHFQIDKSWRIMIDPAAYLAKIKPKLKKGDQVKITGTYFWSGKTIISQRVKNNVQTLDKVSDKAVLFTENGKTHKVKISQATKI